MKDGVGMAMRKLKGASHENGFHSGVGGFFHLRARAVNGVFAFLLISIAVFLVIGDTFPVAEQVRFRLLLWNSPNLQVVTEPRNASLSHRAISSLIRHPHQQVREYGHVNNATQSSIPELEWQDDASSSEEPFKPYIPLELPIKRKDFGEWMNFPYFVKNETEIILQALRENGTRECHNVTTKTGQIVGLPILEEGGSNARIELRAGRVYEFQIISVGEDGSPRCQGGDYYEVDLSGPRWKSRPPVMDHLNGTYTVGLQVDPRFAGSYELKIILLFSNFHGLHHRPAAWARAEEVATFQVVFTRPQRFRIPPLPRCSRNHFVGKRYWTGRWTREFVNEDCEYSRYGRWICVNQTLKCQKPWCEGRVGRLESNGWVYSAHCAFKIFSQEEAWQCLDKKWLYFWGDSNHMDTIRNLLNFYLGYAHSIKLLNRRMDATFYAPGSNNQTSVRITSLFNGHWNVSKNYEGLHSLHNKEFADKCRSYFTGDKAPDIVIMNSGLHDGIFWKEMEKFVTEGVDYTVNFWTNVWENMKARRPDVVYRTTVTTGGIARNQSYNPQKMELMNHIIVDKLARLNLERFQIIDGFDYTYPWHYDHKTNDGVHYGRPPAKHKWAGGNIGHRYFVDLMLVHMLLNAIC